MKILLNGQCNFADITYAVHGSKYLAQTASVHNYDPKDNTTKRNKFNKKSDIWKTQQPI